MACEKNLPKPEKKFDSVEDILKVAEEKHISIFNMHLGFINTLYNFLHYEGKGTLYGAQAEDFFIQGLITIIADPASFEQALETFMNAANMKI